VIKKQTNRKAFYDGEGAAQSSQTDDWATPQHVVDFAAKRFDKPFYSRRFNLDVCASDSNHKASIYYTADTDGLEQTWWGNVWLNPPYGRSIGRWIDKAVESIQEFNGDCQSVTLCIPARTDTRWFHKLIENGAEVVFIKGRLKFGAGTAAAPFPSCLVYLERGQTTVQTTYEVIE